MAAFVFRCKCERNWWFFCINPVTGWIEILPTLWYVDSKFICFEKTYPATSEKFYNISRYKMNILYWQCGSIENVIERYVAICYLTAPSNLPEPVLTLDFWYSCQCDFIARTHGCARNDSETHETALLDCTTGEAGSNPATPVECVSLSFRTHPCILAFITYILCTNGIDMVLV